MIDRPQLLQLPDGRDSSGSPAIAALTPAGIRDALVAALGSAMGQWDDEIADTIWLASKHVWPAAAEPSPVSPVVTPERGDILRQDEITKGSIGPKDETQPPTGDSRRRPEASHISRQLPPSEVTKEVGRFILPTRRATPDAGISVGTPGGRGLSDPLSLARAARPLHMRVPSRTTWVFDEEATVNQIAESNLWGPVLRPARQRWLDLALLIDMSPTMLMWQPTVRALRLLFERLGAFRDVRVWQFDSSNRERVELRNAQNFAVRNGKELLSADQRRTMVIVTDCLGDAWASGAAAAQIAKWEKVMPVALLQMFPQVLWRQTALANAPQVHVSAPRAAAPNAQLQRRGISSARGPVPSGGIAVPVFTMDSRYFAAWAKLIAGKPQPRAMAVILQPGKPTTAAQLTKPDRPLTAEQRIANFNRASPLARQLADLFCSVAPLRLPLLRLIQDVMLPESGQVHLAEVLLGGLLHRKPTSAPASVANDESIEFAWHKDVRDLLLARVPLSQSIRVLRATSEYVERYLNIRSDFEALLANPDHVPTEPGSEDEHSFAEVSKAVLQRLGGKYAQLVSRPARDTQPTFDPGPHLSLGMAQRFLRWAGENGVNKEAAEALLFEPRSPVARDLWPPSDSIERTCAHAVELLSAVTGSDYVQIFRKEGGLLKGVSRKIGTGKEASEVIRLGSQGIVSRAFQTQRPLYAPAVEGSDFYIEVEPTTQSEFAVPILLREEPWGMVNIEWDLPSPLRTQESDWLTALIDSLGEFIAQNHIGPAEPSPFAGKSILWVDNHHRNNISIRSALEAEGAVFELVESTDQALSLLENRYFDAIISDLARPESREAGLDLLKRISSHCTLPPYAIFAHRRAVQFRSEALAAGAVTSTDLFSEVRRAFVAAWKKHASRQQTPFTGKWILWVDDFPGNNVHQRALLENAGALIYQVLSTEEALSMVERRSFDAIISDLGRGDEPFAGMHLLTALRPRGYGMPYALYASRAPQHRDEALRLGAIISTNNFDEVLAVLEKSFAPPDTGILPLWFIENATQFLEGYGSGPREAKAAAMDPSAIDWHGLWTQANTEGELCTLLIALLDHAFGIRGDARPEDTRSTGSGVPQGSSPEAHAPSIEGHVPALGFQAWIGNAHTPDMVAATPAIRHLEAHFRQMVQATISAGQSRSRVLEQEQPPFENVEKRLSYAVLPVRLGRLRPVGALLVVWVRPGQAWAQEWVEGILSSLAPAIERFERIAPYTLEKHYASAIHNWITSAKGLSDARRAAICQRVARRAAPFLALIEGPFTPAGEWIRYCEIVARDEPVSSFSQYNPRLMERDYLQGAVEVNLDEGRAARNPQARCRHFVVALIAQAVRCCRPENRPRDFRDLFLIVEQTGQWATEAGLVGDSWAEEFSLAMLRDTEVAAGLPAGAPSHPDILGPLWKEEDGFSVWSPTPVWQGFDGQGRRILVAGIGSPEIAEPLRTACRQIARSLAGLGYTLMVGSWPGVDAEVARAFAKALPSDRKLEDYLLENIEPRMEPRIPGGELVYAGALDQWYQTLADRADAVILLNGAGGTADVAHAASSSGIPIFPIGLSGGDAEAIFRGQLGNWDTRPVPGLSREQYALLGEEMPVAIDLMFHLLPHALRSRPSKINPPLQLLATLSGHKDVVLRVSWNGDGTRIATCSVDHTVKIWAAATGHQVVELQGHAYGVNGAAWSPDGSLLATCSHDHTIRIWSTSDWKCLLVLEGHGGDVSDVVWSMDGQYLASASEDQTCRIWDAVSGVCTATLRGHASSVTRLLSLPNGDLISSDMKGLIHRWPGWGGSPMLVDPTHEYGVTGLASHPTGDSFVSSSFDHHIFVHHLDGRPPEKILHAHQDVVRSVSLSPDGRVLASNGREHDGYVTLWRTDTWQKLYSFPEPATMYWTPNVVWSPTLCKLATLGQEDHAVRIWRVKVDDDYRNFPGHSAAKTEVPEEHSDQSPPVTRKEKEKAKTSTKKKPAKKMAKKPAPKK